LPFEVDPEPDVLVTAAQAAVEFGVCRRTIGRRVVESQAVEAIVVQSRAAVSEAAAA